MSNVPTKPQMARRGEVCDGVTAGAGATYGVPGQLALGYELTAETTDAERRAGWNPFVLFPLVLLVAAAIAMAGRRPEGSAEPNAVRPAPSQ